MFDRDQKQRPKIEALTLIEELPDAVPLQAQLEEKTDKDELEKQLDEADIPEYKRAAYRMREEALEGKDRTGYLAAIPDWPQTFDPNSRYEYYNFFKQYHQKEMVTPHDLETFKKTMKEKLIKATKLESDKLHCQLQDKVVAHEIYEKLRKVFALVENDGNPLFVRKVIKNNTVTMSISSAQRSADYDPVFKCHKKILNFKKFLIESGHCIPRFTHLVFQPNPKGNIGYGFNTFMGFKAKRVEKVDMTYVQPWLDHLRNNLNNGNEKQYEWDLARYHQMFKYPWKKTKVMRIRVSKKQQTAGKSISANFTREYIYGDALALEVNGVEAMCTAFNAEQAGKLFIHVDELKRKGLSSQKDEWTQMNAIITRKDAMYNQKHVPTYRMDDFVNIEGSTNHPGAVDLSEGNQRIALVETSCEHGPEDPYWENLMKFYNQNAADHYFTYIYNLDKYDSFKLRPVPLSDAMHKAKEWVPLW